MYAKELLSTINKLLEALEGLKLLCVQRFSLK